ncbi:hypothetical protein Scep_020424 [Stephania cephalantha]|uniref:Uncharacterized protein n=1 Tax=Stephania cephalantha TaxID=152367 RepID=A0AAP0ID45_9MAGN
MEAGEESKGGRVDWGKVYYKGVLDRGGKARKSAGDGRREERLALDDLAPGDGGAVKAGKQNGGKALRKPLAKRRRLRLRRDGEGAGTTDAVMQQQQHVTSWKSGSRAVMQQQVTMADATGANETTWQRPARTRTRRRG